MPQNNKLPEAAQLQELLQHMTPEEVAIVDEILAGADPQMELVAVLRSGCTLEELVSGSYR